MNWYKMLGNSVCVTETRRIGRSLNEFPSRISLPCFHKLCLTPFVYYNSVLTNGSKNIQWASSRGGIKAQSYPVWFRPSFPVCLAPPMLTHKERATGEAFLVIFLAASSFHFPWKWYFTNLGNPLQQYSRLPAQVTYQLFNAKCLRTRHCVKMAPSLPWVPPS
jgi:hypothetical protein